MKNERGFSLIELVTSIAIGAILLLIIGASIDYMLTARRTLNQNAATIELTHLTRVLLANRASCTLNLKDQALSMASPAGTVITELKELDATTATAGRTMASVSGTPTPQEGYTVQEMRIVPRSQVSFDRILADFKIKLELERVIGSRTKEESFPVLARVVSGQIVECVAIEPEVSDLNRADFCLFVTGSRRYDPVTKQCLNPTVQCFTGTRNAAQCGAGFALKPGFDACQTRMPAGFADPTPAFSVDYGGGGSHPWRASYSIGERTGANSCSCDYAVDLGSLSNGALCEACCISTTDP